MADESFINESRVRLSKLFAWNFDKLTIHSSIFLNYQSIIFYSNLMFFNNMMVHEKWSLRNSYWNKKNQIFWIWIFEVMSNFFLNNQELVLYFEVIFPDPSTTFLLIFCFYLKLSIIITYFSWFINYEGYQIISKPKIFVRTSIKNSNMIHFQKSSVFCFLNIDLSKIESIYTYLLDNWLLFN